MSDKNRYQVDLKDTPFPEALAAVGRMKVPGVLEVRAGGTVRRLFIAGGCIVHAVSDQRDDSLGAHLVRARRLSPAGLEKLTRRRLATEKRFGELLVDFDLMAPADVLQGLRDHLESIVWILFEDGTGEAEFEVGELKGDVSMQIQLPIYQAILRGIRKVTNPKQAVARLGRRATIFEPAFRTEALIRLGLEVDEVRLLRQVDGKRSLLELFESPMGSPGGNAKLLYAFWVLRLMRRSRPKARTSGQVKVKLRSTGDAFPG